MLGIEILLLIPFTLKYQFLSKEGRLIYFYLIVSIILGAGSDILGRMIGNNMLFYSSFMLIQFGVLSMFYLQVIRKPSAKKIIKVVLALAAIVYVLDITVLEGHKQSSSIFISFRNAAVIVYGIIFFLQLLHDEDLVERSVYINTLPSFWYNSGLFIYTCCSFLMYLSYNFLQSYGQTEALLSVHRITMSLNFIAGILQLILFYIGVLKVKKGTYERS